MAFQLSPGVNVSEVDLTTVIPAVSTSAGALVGQFAWGPANKRILVDSEITLVNRFGKPNNDNFEDWFSAANFLAYGNNLRVVRVVGANTKNATSGSSAVLIDNEDTYEIDFAFGTNSSTYGQFAARYPGDLGNSLAVHICANATEFAQWTYKGYFDAAPGTSLMASSLDASGDEMHVVVVDVDGKISGSKNNVLEVYSGVSKAVDAKLDDGTPNYWVTRINENSKYVYVLSNPNYVTNWGSQMSGVTFKENAESQTFTVNNLQGSFNSLTTGEQIYTGNSNVLYASVVGTVVSYANNTVQVTLTKGSEFKSSDTIYKTAVDYASANVVTETIYNSLFDYTLANGVSDVASTSNYVSGWDQFADANQVDVSLLVAGGGVSENSPVVVNKVSQIAYTRKDCVAFISPPRELAVSNNVTSTAIVDWRNSLASAETNSSYVVCDSGWKYQFDKYNNVYRYIPLNADVAGLCVNTDTVRDPWWSPAGFNRGGIKNVVKLSWNPSKTDRDVLYPATINPVVSFPGEGTVLYGDRTMQLKPSAFDRINVRRLFITLEKAIARAAKYSLFEFNDEFTRAQFVALVEPYLRDVKGRRGIYDYRVVCDTTNNTPEVIDRNEFVGDIYIKPARSINFIQLNFVAVRTGVEFSEIVGKF